MCRSTPDSCLPVDGRICHDGSCGACSQDVECGEATRRCCDRVTGRCRAREWATVSTAALERPELLAGAAVAFDPAERRVWLFGGRATGAATDRADLWMLDLGASGGPLWQRIVVNVGEAPGPRSEATLIVDPLGRRLVLFGGQYYPSQTGTFHDDVWTFSLDSRKWTEFSKPEIDGAAVPWPSGRSQHGAIYDLGQQRMVVFAGRSPSEFLGDVWSLRLDPALDGAVSVSRWFQHEIEGAPTPRAPSYAFDPSRRRVVVMGGLVAGPSGLPGVITRDVWSLWLPVSGEPSWQRLAESAPVLQMEITDVPLGQGIFDARERSFVFLGAVRTPSRLIHVDGEHPQSTFCTLDASDLSLLRDGRSHAPLLYDPSDYAVMVLSGAGGLGRADVAKRHSLACLSRRAPTDGSHQCGR